MTADRLMDSFHVARAWGFHDLEEKPKRGKPNKKLRLAMNNFGQALARGMVPGPDVKRGALNLWRQSTVSAYVDGRFADAKGKQTAKKAEARANGPQQSAPVKKRAVNKVNQSRAVVNGKVGAHV